MLPGIYVDSCSLDAYLLCQDEHKEIIRCLSKESSKDYADVSVILSGQKTEAEFILV